MKIALTHVTKKYDTRVLKDLNLLIEDKKAVGIMGASGSGKSTLLRQLAGIEFPEEGSIMINETAVTRKKAREYQREISVVFQKHNLFPHLSLKKNLLLILEKIKRMDPEEAGQKADVLLDRFHLTEQADKLPRYVSGGQAQRASIARALCTEPELLFLDEPTAALDPILTGEVLEAVTALKHLGKDCVFVTHEIDFLKQFADYFVFMDQGEILEHGQTDLLESPKTDKLAAFLRKEG